MAFHLIDLLIFTSYSLTKHLIFNFSYIHTFKVKFCNIIAKICLQGYYKEDIRTFQKDWVTENELAI